MAIAIEQIYFIVIAFLYLESKQISSSKSNQSCRPDTLFIIRQDPTKFAESDRKNGPYGLFSGSSLFSPHKGAHPRVLK